MEAYLLGMLISFILVLIIALVWWYNEENILVWHIVVGIFLILFSWASVFSLLVIIGYIILELVDFSNICTKVFIKGRKTKK